MPGFEMPKRRTWDGDVSVDWIDDPIHGEQFTVSCASHGMRRGFVCSPYNAVRIMAALASMLGVRFAKSFEKAIKL